MEPEEGLEAQRSHVPLGRPEGAGAETNMARELLAALRRHSSRTLLVDAQSGRQWTGARLLEHCARLATGLLKQARLQANQVVMTICDHSDLEIAMALAVMLAGGALFGTAPSDGLAEVATLCAIVKPDVFVVSPRYHSRALELRKRVAGLQEVKIVWLNDGQLVEQEGDLCGDLAAQESLQQNGAQTSPPSAQDGALKHNGNHTKEHSKANDEDDEIVYAAKEAAIKATREVIERDQVLLIGRFLERPADWDELERVANERINPRKHVLTYMLTSGSTGRPKVVPSTHEELVWGLFSMVAACQTPFKPALDGLDELEKGALDLNGNVEGEEESNNNNNNKNSGRAPLMPCTPDDVFSGDLPLDHGAGFNTMLLTLYLGAKFIVMPSYDEDAFWQAVHDHRISFSLSSTTFCYRLFARLKALLATGEAQRRWNLDSLKLLCCCGAKLAFVELVREVQQHYAHLRMVQAYGCTEIGFISMVHVDEAATHLHSTGYLFPGLRAKVVKRAAAAAGDEALAANCGAAAVCKPEERGELLVWARSKFKGYLCQPNADGADEPAALYAACHEPASGFYKTGDQAHFDAAGRLYIHGRFKDTLCLMEDWQILPAELEELVDEHPLVAASVVVGVPDPELPGCHKPKAFVRLHSPDSAEARQLAASKPELAMALQEADGLKQVAHDIYEFVAARTARPKHLTGGVRILDEFPRVGLLNKVDRKALKLMD